MDYDVPDEAEAVLQKMNKAGYEIYIVGGAVRDLLLGRETYDWDFTTNATPEQILEVFPDGFYDNAFGTVGVASEIEGFRPFEITTYRTEHGYSDSRRPDKVSWGKTLEEDLQRRDFTINAMALAKQNGDYILVDPYEGQKDLKKRVIKAVGDPHERFSEDALRMMRALRFASELNFRIEKETKEAITTHAKTIQKIAKERIRDELLKLIASPHAYNALVEFREVGLMEEILPELEKAFGVEQKSPGRHHIYDVGTHSLMSLKYCQSQDPIVRFATLIHDIGKPQTVKKLPTGVITFYNHEVVGGRIANQIADRLRFSKKQKEKLFRLVRYHQFTVDENQTDSALRRFIRKVGKEYVTDMLDLRVADRLGGGAAETSWRLEEYKQRLVEVQKQPFTVHDLKIDGNDVMKELGITPGPQIGEILERLFKKVEDKDIPNEKEALLSAIKDAHANTR